MFSTVLDTCVLWPSLRRRVPVQSVDQVLAILCDRYAMDAAVAVLEGVR